MVIVLSFMPGKEACCNGDFIIIFVFYVSLFLIFFSSSLKSLSSKRLTSIGLPPKLNHTIPYIGGQN